MDSLLKQREVIDKVVLGIADLLASLHLVFEIIEVRLDDDLNRWFVNFRQPYLGGFSIAVSMIYVTPVPELVLITGMKIVKRHDELEKDGKL